MSTQWRLIKAALALMIAYYCPTAHAEEATIKVHGTLDSRAQLSLPPTAPQSFAELNDSAFYSFSTAVGIREADGRELAVTVYFWRTSSNIISVRAYVDGEYVGLLPGQPTPVGRGRLAFGEDGKWDSRRRLKAEHPSGYILDLEPASNSPTLPLSINWVAKPLSHIVLDFSATTFSPLVSAVGVSSSE